MIAISPDHLNGLTLENIKTKEGKGLIDQYIASLREKNKYQLIESKLNNATTAEQQAIINQQKAATDEDFAKQKYRGLTNTPGADAIIDAFKFGTVHSEQAYMESYYKAQQEAAEDDIKFYQKQLETALDADTKKVAKKKEDVTKNTVGTRGKISGRRN